MAVVLPAAAGAKPGKYAACRLAEVELTDGAESTEGLRETMRSTAQVIDCSYSV
jgi:hypothetical protein